MWKERQNSVSNNIFQVDEAICRIGTGESMRGQSPLITTLKGGGWEKIKAGEGFYG